AEDGVRDWSVTGVQACALPIYPASLNTTVRFTMLARRWWAGAVWVSKMRDGNRPRLWPVQRELFQPSPWLRFGLQKRSNRKAFMKFGQVFMSSILGRTSPVGADSG